MKLTNQVLVVLFLGFAQQGFSQDVPTLEWAKVFSGTLSEIPTGIATDLSGNVYTTGSFNGTTDFDPGAGVFTLTSAAGSPDIFISKIDINGNFVWAKSMGGTGTDNGFAIAVDAVGNVYTTGFFNNSVDFDPGTGTFNITSLGSAEIFVSKLDTDGNFVWAKSAGGTGYQQANAIALDASGNVYTTGYFFGATDFDPSASTFNITPLASEDVFILKLDSNGDFVWAKSFEGASTERGKSIAVDASGNVYTTGFIFNGTMDLDPGVGVLSLTTASFRSMFISKLDIAGNFVWGKAIAEITSVIESESLVLDNSGNILITGSFSGIADFDTGSGVFNLTADSGTSFADIFIVKMDPNGDLVWAKSIGPNSNYQIGTSIIADALGKLYITGRFAGITDFDPGVGIFNLTSAGGADAFVSCLDANGNFLWAIRIGGSGTSGDTGTSINIDALGNVHVTGSFYSPIVDFDFGPCVLNISNTGFGDGFIEKINIGAAIPLPTITSFSPPSGPVGTTVTITGTNFSSVPPNNQVAFFNNRVATVTASTPTSITTTVPALATTGRISATVNCVTVQSATDFTVTTSSTQDFITQWNLATAGSGSTQLSFGTATSGTVNYTWQQLPTGLSGSGSWSGATLTITGLPAGSTIRLQIAPTNFQRININNGTDRNRLTQVEQWGTTAWTSMQTAFRNCLNLQITATDIPNLTGVSNMSEMFSGCDILNSPSNIGSWNTGVVTAMQRMFANTDAFNQNIGAWNTAAVTNMSEMFSSARAFNQPVGGWNTAAVTNMSGMFFYADVFNQDIGAWNTSAVTNMSDMFTEAFVFNQNIGAWNTGAVTNMSNMFSDAIAFNQDISSWNTAAVTNMSGMFKFASVFNQNIGAWNTAAVTTMSQMFSRASAFNQNLSAWNTGAVTSMLGMFEQATAFNQNIGAWTLNPGVDLRFMFDNNGLDCNNYSATLIGWSANPSTPNGRTLGATGRQYGTNAVTARNDLDITKSWTISGDAPSGAVCAPSVPTITSFTPTSGSIGTTVTINGTNFSTTPANNTIAFNGTTAVVTASTTTSITTTVPAGATTGTITVTVVGNTATSATNFTVTASPVITITTQPSDFIACLGQNATFTTAASGATNIIYQWQFSPDGIAPFTDIANGAGYTNANTATLSVNTTANFGLGRYRCRINGDFASEVITTNQGLSINPISTAPTVAGANRCGMGSVTLTASGGTNGQYKWYTTPIGGTAIAGETNSSYVTPSITAPTSYFVSLNTNGCESTRTLVTATLTITPAPTATGASGCPASAVTLTASGGTSGQYNWYTVATGGSAITGATNNTYEIASLTNTSTFYVSLTISGCESTRTAVTATLLSTGCAPVITTQTLTTQVEGKIEINLQSLITTPGTLDPTSIKVITQPASGAVASITNFLLVIDYKGKPFSGKETIIIEACNTNALCTQQTFTIEVAGEVIVFNAVSPNGDGKNEFLVLQYIESISPKNQVSIYNRWGDEVFFISDYDNKTRVFAGRTSGGNKLPAGSYFYKISLNDAGKTFTGFLDVKY